MDEAWTTRPNIAPFKPVGKGGFLLLNVRKYYRERCRRKPPVVLDGASSGLWFDGWKGREPPPFGRYAGADRGREVAAPRTWLLAKGWRRIGLIDPAEVPGGSA